MTWTIPNILTTARLAAAPLLAVMFLYFTRPWADILAVILFAGAAATDWLDGRLARARGQQTRLGAMLDPVADKAMVVIALMVIVGFSSWSPWLVLPATVILFREVFVSGLREFLRGATGTLEVTRLAKWKTTAQMAAIAALFSQGALEHYFGMSRQGMDDAAVNAILGGDAPDRPGLRWKLAAADWSGRAGLWLLWIAAALTLATGWDYFRRAMPYLRG